MGKYSGLSSLCSSFWVFLCLLAFFTPTACSTDEEPADLPSVVTGEVSEITSAGARVSGQVVGDGNLAITERGVVLGLSADPTVSDMKVTASGGVGTFSVVFNGLAAGRTYHVRAFATNSKGTAYGLDRTFNSAATVPTLTTTSATSVTLTTAVSGGNVSSDGGASVTARGVVYSLSPNPTISGSKTTDGDGAGAFVSNLTGLSKGSTYFVRAYATNSAGTAYGDEISLTTLSPVLPTVSTTTASSVGAFSAVSGGQVSADGGADVTARGVCWSTSQNPTISNAKTEDGSGIGSYVSLLGDLSPATTYFVRAYATNSAGTAYGAQVNFTTAAAPATVTDIDGNVYSAVNIGSQVWMKENLRVSKYSNGDPIASLVDANSWASLVAGYCVYGNDANNNSVYGKIYNWLAVSDARGVCPIGWHVPTDAEWTILNDYLGGVAIAGGKMKVTGTDFWIAPNTGATNESGFSALPGGDRLANGTFRNRGLYGLWWSSSPKDGNDIWYRYLQYDGSNLARNYEPNKTGQGYSVRCIKN